VLTAVDVDSFEKHQEKPQPAAAAVADGVVVAVAQPNSEVAFDARQHVAFLQSPKGRTMVLVLMLVLAFANRYSRHLDRHSQSSRVPETVHS
jgi:hypothetical protein